MTENPRHIFRQPKGKIASRPQMLNESEKVSENLLKDIKQNWRTISKKQIQPFSGLENSVAPNVANTIMRLGEIRP